MLSCRFRFRVRRMWLTPVRCPFLLRVLFVFGLSLSNYAATFTFKLCSQTSQLFGLHACTKKHEWLKNFDHALTTLPPNYPFITYVSFINWSNKFVWFQNSKINKFMILSTPLSIIEWECVLVLYLYTIFLSLNFLWILVSSVVHKCPPTLHAITLVSSFKPSKLITVVFLPSQMN